MLVSDFLKQVSLFEYTDPNKDKLLARVEFNAGDPVVISDAFAPMAGQHGVVLAKGTDGAFQVRFGDNELSIPEEHLIHSPAPKGTEYPNDKMLVMARSGALTEVTVDDMQISLDKLSESLEQEIILTLPVQITEDIVSRLDDLCSIQLTESQSRAREEIMFSARASIDALQEAYGDDWSSILFAMATLEASKIATLTEDKEEEEGDALIGLGDLDKEGPESHEEPVAPFFDHTTDSGDHITIKKNGQEFEVSVVDKHGDSIEQKSFSNIGEAEKLAQSFM